MKKFRGYDLYIGEDPYFICLYFGKAAYLVKSKEYRCNYEWAIDIGNDILIYNWEKTILYKQQYNKKLFKDILGHKEEYKKFFLKELLKRAL